MAGRWERALVIRAELSRQNRRINTLEQRLARLTVRAEMSGSVVDLSPFLQQGGWVAEGEPLLALRGQAPSQRIVAYVDQAEVGRLSLGATARFVPEPGIWPDLEAEVVEIAPGGLERVEKALVTSSHGGGIGVRITESGEAIPLRATYQVILAPLDAGSALANEVRGRVAIEAAPQSLLEGVRIRILALLRRESGI